jgi:hypothetical protein
MNERDKDRLGILKGQISSLKQSIGQLTDDIRVADDEIRGIMVRQPPETEQVLWESAVTPELLEFGGQDKET